MDWFIPTGKSGALHMCNAELSCKWDATLPEREPRNLPICSNPLPEKSVACRKLQFAEATLTIVDVLDYFLTRTKIRAIYSSKWKNGLQKLKFKNTNQYVQNITRFIGTCQAGK
ncbi:MAG: hypothetical protein LBI18_06155 [Planctomycetaceae bacterium]|nr:hypothetical protein [Planctomycetaceae bacterium]